MNDVENSMVLHVKVIREWTVVSCIARQMHIAFTAAASARLNCQSLSILPIKCWTRLCFVLNILPHLMHAISGVLCDAM